MVNFPETSLVALRALHRNLMRSGLTALGIIIGVAAVIAVFAVGKGAENTVQQQIASLGTNVLMAFPGSTTQGGVRSGSGGSSRLNLGDLEAIRRDCSAVGLAAAQVRSVVQVVSPTQNWSTVLYGSSPEYQTIRNWILASGEWFTDTDMTSGAGVCVLGKTAADQLFGSDDPIGQSVRIKKVPFRVVGTLAAKGQSAMGDDQDDVIIAPLTTVQRKITGNTSVGTIMASATSSSDASRAQQQMTLLLRQRHRIAPGQDDDFTVRNMADISAAAQATTGVFTTLLTSIALISLLVGGIGIMNIMLVSVTERTREIGIRRSLGARASDILAQFLVEAVVLALLGGATGILLGIAASRVVTYLAEWETTVAPQSIVLAFAFSAGIGLIFGLYPARRAAHLNPIEALRHE